MTRSAKLLREALMETLVMQDATSQEYLDWLHGARSVPFPPSIPAGNLRSWAVSEKVLKHLEDIAETVWTNSNLTRLISRTSAFQTCCRVFGEMLQTLMKIDDEGEGWRTFRTRYEADLNAGIKASRHYTPVWLFVRQKFEDFSVGPVDFLSRESWVAQVEAFKGEMPHWKVAVSQAWEGNLEAIRALDTSLQFEANIVARFANDEQTVASVYVDGFHREEGARRALLATRVALDAMRAYMPVETMSRFATVADQRPAGHIDLFSQRAGTDLLGSSSSSRLGIGGSPGFANEVIESSQDYRVAAGTCISVLLDPVPTSQTAELPGLSERWCNAVHWFGRACTAEADFAAFPMCAIALDILSGGLELKGIRVLAQLLLNIDESQSITGQGMTLKAVVSEIYNMRNHIFHGSELVIDRALAEKRSLAQSITGPLLVAYALRLAEFRRSEGAIDDRDAFVNWLEISREQDCI